MRGVKMVSEDENKQKHFTGCASLKIHTTNQYKETNKESLFEMTQEY